MEGKRRRLLREFYTLQGLKKFLSESMAQSSCKEPQSSVYFNEYCNLNFTPTLEKNDILTEQQENFPLYGGSNKTFYLEKIMNEFVTGRSPVSNFQEPFRRNCNFTTPPEDRLD